MSERRRAAPPAAPSAAPRAAPAGRTLPELSVVVFAREARRGIERALEGLAAQEGIERCEVIVADASTDGTTAVVERFPWVRHLRLAPTTMPAGKAAAIRAARGAVVAVLDAHDRPDPGWLRAIASGLAGSGAVAVGGEVCFDGPHTAASRAGYLFEYGAFAPPLAPGPASGDLPGNNVAYRREVFDETCAELLEKGFWKPFFHERIRAAGGVLALHPAMRVRHRIEDGVARFCLRRFHYGRCFGAMRRRRAGGARKLFLVVAAPGAAPLLFARHLRRALGHPGNRRLLARGWPALLCLCAAWGLGEWLGAWFGPGRSCEEVY